MLLSKSGASYCNAFCISHEQRLCKNAAEMSLQNMRTAISVAVYEQAFGKFSACQYTVSQLRRILLKLVFLAVYSRTVLDNLRLATSKLFVFARTKL